MKTSIIAITILMFAGLLDGFAEPGVSEGATKWCDWTSANVGVSTNFYANNGTITVAKGGDGSFGSGLGEVAFTSNNAAPVAEHQFGNSIWGSGGNIALFDGSALAGKTGLEILVNVDSSSTSDKICIKLLSSTEGDAYVQTVPVERGSTQRVQFPFSGFKSAKNPESTLADFSTLSGMIQITDGWNGYPAPAQVTWICKFSNIYTYVNSGAEKSATGSGVTGTPKVPETPPSH